MKRRIALVVGLACAVGACTKRSEPTSKPEPVAAPASATATVAVTAPAPIPAGSARPDPKPPTIPDGTDITAEVRRWASDEFSQPSAKFRAGHVSKKEFSPRRIERRTNGFRVSMPAGAPMVSPAVYQGKVITGGGFRSKELYAFDARTGEVAWAMGLDDDGPSTPACEDGVCVINTESCTIFAVDAETGRMLWSWWLGDPQTSAPAIAGGRVFTSYPARASGVHGGPNGININNDNNPTPQQAMPQVAAPPGPASTPSGLADGKQRPPGVSHALAAFELKTGKLIWQRWLDSDVMSAPVAVEDELYVTTLGGNFYRFAQRDGHVRAARKARATSAPVVAGGDVFFTQRTDDPKAGKAAEGVVAQSKSSNRQHAWVGNPKAAPYLDRAVQQASKLWKQGVDNDTSNGFAGGPPVSANAAVATDNIGQGSVHTLQAFQGSRVLNFADNNYNAMGDEVVCTDPSSGKTLWSVKLSGDMRAAGGFLAAPPVAAGGHLFVGTLAGKVLQIEPQTGKTVRTFEVGSRVRSQPVVHGGWIYVGTEDGKLVAIDTGDAANTGWAQWGANAARTGML